MLFARDEKIHLNEVLKTMQTNSSKPMRRNSSRRGTSVRLSASIGAVMPFSVVETLSCRLAPDFQNHNRIKLLTMRYPQQGVHERGTTHPHASEIVLAKWAFTLHLGLLLSRSRFTLRRGCFDLCGILAAVPLYVVQS